MSLGLGLGSAFAADAVRLSVPEPSLSAAIADSDVAASQWRVFDPGFIVDHLPFKLTIGQTISYTDNVQNTSFAIPLLASNNTIFRLPSRGDFYSDTTISAASRFPMGAQSFFFNATYAPRRYFRDTQLDADNYAINGGVDYNIADRCSGRLIGGTASNQSSFPETAGFGVNTTETTSFNETARCRITGHIFGLLNSGVSHQDSSGTSAALGGVLPFSLNSYDQQYIGTGLEYDLTALDTLRGQATFTNRDFLNRTGALGLAPNTQQDDYVFFYDRTFSAKLNGSVSGGFSVFSTTASSASLIEPVYSVSINYNPTPKINASFSESRSSGAPQSVISDIQTIDSQTLSLSYRYSPKLNVSGILSRSESRNPTLGNSPLNNSALPIIYANSNINGATLALNYSASPLVTATASYSYTERTDTSRSGYNAVSNIFRVGLFYTR